MSHSVLHRPSDERMRIWLEKGYVWHDSENIIYAGEMNWALQYMSKNVRVSDGEPVYLDYLQLLYDACLKYARENENGENNGNI